MSVSVDQILQRMITDACNMDPNLIGKITQGTETYIRFATNASAIWGLYKQYDWTVDQIFPSTMSKESLEKYATERGKDVSEMTGADILEFVIQYLRKPPSGGKASDYERWALETVSPNKPIGLTSDMVVAQSGFDVDGWHLVHPRNGFVAFEVDSDDVGKYFEVDLGSDKDIAGIGIGFTTRRNVEFYVYYKTSSDNDYTLLGTIDSGDWSIMNREFTASSIKIEVSSVEALESWQDEDVNSAKCFGMEIYESEGSEKATYAKSIMNSRGVGTMSILVAPENLSMKACKDIESHCIDEGPVAPKELYVSTERDTTLDIKVYVNGGTITDVQSFHDDIGKYFSNLKPGDMFVSAQILVFAIKYGATYANIAVQVGDGGYHVVNSRTADYDEKFVLGAISEVYL